MRKLLYILTTLFVLTGIDNAAATPRIAVNIIINGMQAVDLERYSNNFGEGGFRRIIAGGTVCTECYTDFTPTSQAMALSTLATGTLPSMHGIVSTQWYDRNHDNAPCYLARHNAPCDDTAHNGINSGYDSSHFTAETLAQAVTASHPKSRAITIAQTSQSALALTGSSGECYWIDNNGRWATASCYASSLPSWVNGYNLVGMNRIFALGTWFGKYGKSRYHNDSATVVMVYDSAAAQQANKASLSNWVDELRYTPAGNGATFEFAKRCIDQLLDAKESEGCRLLNICLDTPCNIVERYGTNSVEYEDMLYCLDTTLAEFFEHLYSKSSPENVLVTLTAARGTLPTQKQQTTEQFNSRKMLVILNAFLSARYGQGNWVLGYHNKAIYLNRNLIYKHKLSVGEIQTEAATFVMQMRGIANATAGTSLQNGQSANAVQRLMQNAFNARTSGDIIVALLPRTIDDTDNNRLSTGGSPYNYDRHVPLVFYCGGSSMVRHSQMVSTTSIAATTAVWLQIERPMCCDGTVIDLNRKK